MADLRPIKVTIDHARNRHVCNPTTVTVDPGDTVAWVGDESFFVLFTDESPFEEGQGIFTQGQRGTIKSGLPHGKKYMARFKVGDVFLMDTEGFIIIR